MIKKLFSAVLSVVLVGGLFLFALVSVVDGTFFSGDFYRKSLNKEQLVLLGEALAVELYAEEDFLKRNFEEEDVRREIAGVVGSDEFRGFVDDFAVSLDEFRAHRNGDFKIKTDNLKLALTKFGKNLTGKLLASMPVCAGEVEDVLKNSDLKCRPAGISTEILYQQYNVQLRRNFDKLFEDELVVFEDQQNAVGLIGFLDGLVWLRYLMVVVISFGVVGIVVLGGLDKNYAFGHVGSAFLFAGLGLVGLVLLRVWLFAEMSGVNLPLIEFVKGVIEIPFGMLNWYGVVMIVVGVGLLLMRYVGTNNLTEYTEKSPEVFSDGNK